MKITILISTIILLGTSSCKKYYCECTSYNVNSPESGGKGYFFVGRIKNKAHSKCVDHSTQPDSYGNYTTCVIK